IDVLNVNDEAQETQTDKLLDIRDLATVLQELTLNQQFDYFTNWKQLGLYLGLYQPTLRGIEVNCRGKGEDGVRETRGGGSNWISLVAALDAMGEREVANNIRIKHELDEKSDEAFVLFFYETYLYLLESEDAIILNYFSDCQSHTYTSAIADPSLYLKIKLEIKQDKRKESHNFSKYQPHPSVIQPISPSQGQARLTKSALPGSACPGRGPGLGLLFTSDTRQTIRAEG
uniref:Death domain-containing protein n=1 Tax=Amphimedon queenslandica TaxID=400682 RepID=A0A1X7TG39_AMPQE